ncbi:hypothetical protein Emed_001700 [Eimeria media]
MEKKRKKHQHLEDDAVENEQQQQQQQKQQQQPKQQKQQQKQQQQQQQQHKQQQQQQQQQQQKRQKGDKRIRQQEAKRLRDSQKAEAAISALQQTLNPSFSEETDKPSQTLNPSDSSDTEQPSDLGPSHAAETKSKRQQQQQQQQQQQEQQQRKQQQTRDLGRTAKKQKTQSLSEFSAAIAAALAENAGKGAVSLAADPEVLRKTEEEKTQEAMRRQLLAERRLRRNMQHRQPSEDDPEVEANLKRLATKGTVSFLNVLMAARRQQAAQTDELMRVGSPSTTS